MPLYSATIAEMLNAAINARLSERGYLYESERVALGAMIDGVNAALAADGQTCRIVLGNPDLPQAITVEPGIDTLFAG